MQRPKRSRGAEAKTSEQYPRLEAKISELRKQIEANRKEYEANVSRMQKKMEEYEDKISDMQKQLELCLAKIPEVGDRNNNVSIGTAMSSENTVSPVIQDLKEDEMQEEEKEEVNESYFHKNSTPTSTLMTLITIIPLILRMFLLLSRWWRRMRRMPMWGMNWQKIRMR